MLIKADRKSFDTVVHTASDLRILILEDIHGHLNVPEALKELDTVRVDVIIPIVELLME